MNKTHQFPSTIDLNVGGHHFTTHLSTLTREPDSLLTAMFDGTHSLTRDKDGRYFIDSDGEMFSHILNFLRHGEPPPANIAEKVKRYAAYFGLHSLVDIIGKMPRNIDINVGGRYFTVLMSTLRKEPDSKLAAFENFPVDQNGRYFIDADGYLFSLILDFLRFGNLPPPNLVNQVYFYASYFELKEMKRKLSSFLPVIHKKFLENTRLLYPNYPDILDKIVQKVSAQAIQDEGETICITLRCMNAPRKERDICVSCQLDGILVKAAEKDRSCSDLIMLIKQDLKERGFIIDDIVYCHCRNAVNYNVRELPDIWFNPEFHRKQCFIHSDDDDLIQFMNRTCAAYSYTLKMKITWI